MTLLKPALYGLPADPPEKPHLHGGRCRCGYVFFPMQTYGCEMCGRHGEALTSCQLAGRGTLLAEAVVHLHADKSRAAPFTVVKIQLDDGPVVRSLLATQSAAVLPGQRLVATLETVDRTSVGEPILDLRFTSAV